MNDLWGCSFGTIAFMVILGYSGFVLRGMEPERALAIVVGSAIALGVLVRFTLSIAFPSVDNHGRDNPAGSPRPDAAPVADSQLQENA